MVLGHLAVAYSLRTKKTARVPLAVLTGMAFAPDVVQAAVYWTFGLAHSLPWSHSIPAVILVALICAAACGASLGAPAAGAAAIAVLSHWPLDVITGNQKPTWPGGPGVGLDLYRFHAADVLLEVAMLGAAMLVYRRRGFRPDPRIFAAAAALQVMNALIDVFFAPPG